MGSLPPQYLAHDSCQTDDVSRCVAVAHQGFDPGLFFGLAMVPVLFAYDGWTNVVTGGYWTCCDCRCGDRNEGPTCGCAQFSGSPAPRPDSPGENTKT